MAEYGIHPPGYRLPDATTLGAVRLQVADLNRSRSYYERVLGFEVQSQSDGVVALGPGGHASPLVWLHERSGVRPVSRSGLFGLYHFAILLPERAALGRFVSHLGQLGAYAGSADHAVSEALYLTDPDGLGIEVYTDRPRSAWKRQGQELHMTTDPLDIRSLLSAAGGQPWTGMPHGTVMGHVHLHVGNLERGAAFYHAGLGFDKVVWSYPGALFLSAGGYHHHLGTNTWSPGPAATDDDARLLSWTVVVPSAGDAAAAGESLRSAGYAVHRRDGAATVSDPWGTTLRIVHGQEPG